LESVPDLRTYDIVHIHGVFNLDHIFIARLLFKMKIPYIVSMHGNLMEQALQHSKLKKKVALELFIKNMLNKASTLHALAKEEQIDIEKLVHNNNFKIIHNGVEIFNNSKTIKKFSDNILKLLFIGRIDINHKGLDTLLDAVEKQKEIWRDKVRLYLVGPFNTKSDEEFVRNRLEDNIWLKEIVKIEGPKYGDEKNNYYDNCDLFIHTSRYEGMPMAVLEAMQVGMPCLVTPGTNMANIMKESAGGVVVNDDVDSIIEGIESIKNLSKEEFLKIGENARRWCAEYLNWDSIATQYEEMYYTTGKLKNKIDSRNYNRDNILEK
jgi:glycosyltransferase involved in cell wall biosynthesis